MRVSYFYCPHCGIEEEAENYLAVEGTYANGTFLHCDECGGKISPATYDEMK